MGRCVSKKIEHGLGYPAPSEDLTAGNAVVQLKSQSENHSMTIEPSGDKRREARLVGRAARLPSSVALAPPDVGDLN